MALRSTARRCRHEIVTENLLQETLNLHPGRKLLGGRSDDRYVLSTGIKVFGFVQEAVTACYPFRQVAASFSTAILDQERDRENDTCSERQRVDRLRQEDHTGGVSLICVRLYYEGNV